MNTVKNSVAFSKSSKIIKNNINHLELINCQNVIPVVHVVTFFRKPLHWLRLPIEIRSLTGTTILTCQQQIELNILHLRSPYLHP